MTLANLSNKTLIEALEHAEKIALDREFISILKEELKQRHVHGEKV